MAEISHTSTDLGDNRLVVWENVTQADTFEALNLSQFEYKNQTLQIGGTFGGATIAVEGSNDDTVYAGLSDQNGTAISVTAAAIRGIGTDPAYIKPVATGGVGQSVTVKLLLRR